jgi:hypothetical protein
MPRANIFHCFILSRYSGSGLRLGAKKFFKVNFVGTDFHDHPYRSPRNPGIDAHCRECASLLRA